MKRNLTGLLPLALLMCGCSSNSLQLASPDNAITFDLAQRGDTLFYEIKKDNQQIVDLSPVILSANASQLGVGITEISAQKTIQNRDYTEKHFVVEHKNKEILGVNVRLYNDGVAFNYCYNATDSVEMNDFTSFCLPANRAFWGQNNSKHYEGAYRKYNTDSLPDGMIFGPPATIEYGNNMYASITESGVYDFAGSRLKVAASGVLQNNPHSGSKVMGETCTPWHVIMIGDLNALVNNQIIERSAKPLAPIYAGNMEWIKPGRCAWSWLAGYGVTYENMIRFTDWASELGFEYNLVDEGWSYWKDGDKSDWELVAQLAEYGKSKGVETLIWKAFPDRAGIDGIQTEERVRSFFEKCKQAGVSGVKIDFFDSESQDIMQYMARTLEIAAEYELIVNYHGCTKPTGLEYTYPNELTREGILGLEYGASWADQTTVTPFTRFLAGHGDYTCLTFSPGFMGETSKAHQLATAIVFDSPLMCYGGNPEDFINSEYKDLISSIPPVWDETRVLPASQIGSCVAFARRNGDNWFVGVLGNEAQSMSLALDFLDDKTYDAWIVDDATNTPTQTVKKGESLQVNLQKSGGCAIRLTPRVSH